MQCVSGEHLCLPSGGWLMAACRLGWAPCKELGLSSTANDVTAAKAHNWT